MRLTTSTHLGQRQTNSTTTIIQARLESRVLVIPIFKISTVARPRPSLLKGVDRPIFLLAITGLPSPFHFLFQTSIPLLLQITMQLARDRLTDHQTPIGQLLIMQGACSQNYHISNPTTTFPISTHSPC